MRVNNVSVAKRYARSLVDVAKAFGVTEKTVHTWKHKSGWPSKLKSGWSIHAIDQWLKEHRLGPHIEDKPVATKPAPKANGNGRELDHTQYTLTEARIIGTLEKAARDEIAKRRELIEEQRTLGNILLAEDVVEVYSQTRGIVATIVDSIYDAHDRELPEKCPSADAWPAIRERILELDRKLVSEIAGAMDGLRTN